MAIDKETVKYVAKLSRIKLDDDKIDDFTHQLDDILSYIEKLNQLDTDNIQPTSHVLGLENVFRKDINILSLDNDLTLSNAPAKEDGHFKVPKII
jgi:aspartyl-tRNA(Asn)/glutamyl-tRNA(Gln) amidotransferase subunit C